MSILNTTPDSFFDGGNYNSLEGALKKVEKDLELGATIIDIGGYSTRPNGNDVSTDEEIKNFVKTSVTSSFFFFLFEIIFIIYVKLFLYLL